MELLQAIFYVMWIVVLFFAMIALTIGISLLLQIRSIINDTRRTVDVARRSMEVKINRYIDATKSDILAKFASVALPAIVKSVFGKKG